MISINIYYTGKADKAQQFAREMKEKGLVDRIRQQTGNLRYEYFTPLGQPETILLIDAWAKQSSLDAHHQSPMMDEIIALREKYDLTMTVERFVSDTNGIPEYDATFIRESQAD
ncbi:putative quinol monooxygenase [Fundicoccus sp. Sow4_D5]|uniref:putative quinol monooxygenase n=1 Tax=Fundicoccus sp. Sow4_D5 TaxID=3438782 RepID=UPI003F9295AC